jgi:hypothetical protein
MTGETDSIWSSAYYDPDLELFVRKDLTVKQQNRKISTTYSSNSVENNLD